PFTESVAHKQDAFEGKLESVACVDRIEQVPGVSVALHRDLLPGCLVPVRELNSQREVAGIDEEARLDQISIDGVPTGPAPGLDFECDPLDRMERIDLVCQ